MFDIDKIFISSIQHNVVNGKVASYPTDSAEYIRNELIRNYLAVLCATDNAMHLLNGSIDKDTKLLTDIRDLLESEKKKPTLTPFTSFTLSSQSLSKMDFIMGKFGIGPFALNNNSHILTMLYGVEFADNPGILRRLGKTSLHEMVDDDGNSIMSWLSGLINAHVDVAKDPYIGRLGVNTYTYNLVNLLIRTGFGKKTFFLTTQPVMKQFATAYSVASGVYMLDKTISKSKRLKEAIQSAWLKMLKDKYGYEYRTIKEGRSKFREYFTMMYGVETDAAIDALMSKNNDVLQRISVSGIENVLDDSKWEFEVNSKKIAPTTFEIQMLVAEANEQFRPYAEKLADLVKYAKIDTKKQGKNITQQRMYEAGFNSIFKSKAFKQTGLSRMRNMSYINAKTENALTLFKDIIGSQVIEGTDSFWEMTTLILEMIGKKGVQDEKIVKAVMNAIKSKIKSGYFFADGGYCERHNIDPKSLVSGNNTIYDRLQKLLAKILGDPAYAEYREKGGVPKNYLLKTLVSASVWEAPVNQYDEKNKKWSLGKGTASDAYKNAKFVRPLNFLSDDPVEQDLFTQGWYELLNDNGFPEGQEFARDLIVYAFITSGANGGKFDLFKYVPNEWKENIDGVFEDSFSYYMQQLLNDWKAGKSLSYADIEDILVNNWFDDNLVPTYKMIDENKHLNFTAIRTDDKNGYPLVLAAVSRSDKRDYVKIKPKEAPAFIKIQRNENTTIGQRNYVIYLLSGFYSTARGHNGEMIDFPVYTAVDPKGTRYPSFETIYEYGWDAANSSETKDAVLKLLSDFLESQDMLTKPYIDLALSGTTNIVKAILDFIRDHQELEDRYKLLKIDPLLEYLAEGIEQKPVEAEVAIEPEDTGEQPQPAPNTYTPGTIARLDINSISDNTASFGVEVSNGSKDFWHKVNDGWLSKHQDGIVAYRRHGDSPETFTPDTVRQGWIGNPFSTQDSKGAQTVQQFYDWLVYGNNFGETRANEEFRQAIIDKILATPDGAPILYYTELNRPSHATVIGYLVNNKHLLLHTPGTQTESELSKEGKAILNKNNIVNEDRHSNGHVRGGQSGWKVRFVVKNPKTGKAFTVEEFNADKSAYFEAAKPLLEYLKEYFKNPDGSDTITQYRPQSDGYSAHYHYTDSSGKVRESFKLLSGGEVGESDFTIYIGSRDDVNKFISDVKNSSVYDIIAEGNNNSSDISFDGKIHGRVEGRNIGFSGYMLPEGLLKMLSDETTVYEDTRVEIFTLDKGWVIRDKTTGDLYAPSYLSGNGEDTAVGYVNHNILQIRNAIAENVYGEYITGTQLQSGISNQVPASPFANVQGENISSDGSEFAKQLTNPGNNLQVEYKGKTFRNAEHAYQTWKSGEFDQVAYENGERGAFKPKGVKPVNKATSFQTMVEILTAKLEQHPELVLGILDRGGIFYLLKSTHNVFGDAFWETSGKNGFMKALRQAYDNVINNSNYNPFNNADDNQLVLDVKDTVDIRSVDATILTIEGKKDEFSKEERQSIKSILGDTRPKVLVASEHTDPVWHAKAIKLMVEEELKKPAKDRKFHMMYLITKHDGLPLRELAELKIPKFVHFSITSLGSTKYEPGVMKMDDMLDRIQEFIKEGVLNPNLVTIRIDPIIPGVTTNEDIEHIVQRATAMGIKQFKFSIMDSYGYTATGQRSNNNRYIIPKMEQLGYNWDEYYGKNAAGIVNFDAKPQYMEQIYTFMDGLAQKYNIWFNTCGERPANIPNLTKIRWSMGCVNVQSMNAAMGTTDIANTQGNQRPGCTCYGNIVDALEYSDKCASSCVYCYAKHNSDAAVLYYNEDGTLKDNRFTRTSETPNNDVFNPGSIESVVAESLTKPDQQEVQQPDENGEILGRLGVDKSQLIALLGNTMYTANVQQVAEKELVLNAFDAVKIAMSQGAIQKGQIEVSIDNSERTISISDNGSGMTPEIVQKAFFTIGGSYKGDNVDNRLKSGGLGLAKMAFLFTADYVELTTVKDGKKTYTKATPQQIQNDDFKIVVTNTSEPNGTTVTVKIPETYRDQEGNEREIWFSSWGKGFFDHPMIGNVEVTKKVNGRVDWEEDFNKIPEGYTFIGTATSDFGEIEIYKDFSNESDSVDVLISGLYQFTNSVYTWNDDGTHYRTIVNILPSVGTKSEVYPINNQREGFRATVDPEIKDLKFFLKRLDTMFEKKKLKASFGTSFNMSPEQLKQITPKSTTFTADLILEVLDEIKAKYKQPYSGSQNDGENSNFGIPLSTITEERKESEKIRKSSFDASSIPILDLNTYVDTTNMDITKPVFHNNTDFLPSDGTVKFLTEYGGMMIQLRDLFLQLHSTSKNYQRIAQNAATQYWGISLDKTYNGVNVSPRLFNFLGLNPIGMVEMLIKEDVVDDFEYVLEEILFHNLLHEINHNAVSNHNESFTVQFQYTYSEFAKLGRSLQQWRQGVRDLILKHLTDLIKDAKRFEDAKNIGDALEGRSQQPTLEESEENSVRANEQTTEGSKDERVLLNVISEFVTKQQKDYLKLLRKTLDC